MLNNKVPIPVAGVTAPFARSLVRRTDQTIKPPGIQCSCVAPQVVGEFELPLLAVQRHGSLELEEVELADGAVKLID